MVQSVVNDGFTVKGIGMSTYGVGGYADSTIGDFAAAAKLTGANSAVIGNVALIDLATDRISSAYSGSYNQSARMEDVDTAIHAAQAQGLSVFLKPQLVTHDPAFSQYTSGDWINLVNPNLVIANPDGFFSSYKDYILQWAQLAEKNHVASLSIGNEMVAATKPEFTHYWNDIIDAVRSVYHGELTYSALLPLLASSNSNEVQQIQFWDKLDYAGFDVYPSLASKNDPSVAELNASWHSATVYGQTQDYYKFVSDMAAEVGKPVVFTETGLPSFQGAANRETSSDGNIGSPTSGNSTAATDYAEQANWWQSFFETWAVNKPQWLKGAYVWNNDPEDLGSTYANSYNINGKPAEGVVASWYGGKAQLAAMSDTLVGSQGDDRLFSYGGASGSMAVSGSALAASHNTTVSISLTASVIAGQSPSFELYVNGTDYGRFDVKPTDSGYVSGNGVHFVTNQTFSVSLPGLQALDSIKVAWAGPTQVNGIASTLYFNGVSVDGVALGGLTYTAAGGYVQQQQQFGNGTSSQWNAGSTSFDTAAWNKALAGSAIGTAAAPINVSGNGGHDILSVLGSQSAYGIARGASGELILSEDSGLHQNIVSRGISEVVFQDGGRLVTGSDGTISLSGGGARSLLGGGGDDRLSLAGTTGAMVIGGGSGSDTITGGGGNNHIYGNAPAGKQGAADGNDMIVVDAGTNYVNGNGGNDTIIAGTAGSVGGNRLLGGGGDDVITLHGSGMNNLNGNLGNDVLDGRDAYGNNLLRGGQGDDVLRAGHGHDLLMGDIGNDTLVAGSGGDHLDLMTGGNGSDLFDLSGGAATPVTIAGTTYYQAIHDLEAADHIRLPFVPGAGDVLSANTAFGSVAAAQVQAQAVLAGHSGYHDVFAAAVGSDTYLFYASGGGGNGIDSVLRLDGVAPAAISSGFFI